MMPKVMRVLAVIVLLFSALSFPVWITAILALSAMLYFPYFIEAVVIFLISDLLFAAPAHKLYSFLFALLVFIVIEVAKRKLRFKQSKKY